MPESTSPTTHGVQPHQGLRFPMLPRKFAAPFPKTRVYAGGDGRVRVRVRRRHRCGSGGYVDVTWNSCFREDGKVFAQLTVT